jgi:hypothetical protein
MLCKLGRVADRLDMDQRESSHEVLRFIMGCFLAVDKADRPHRDFRIENTLTDEHGDEVKLKKGAHVEVTVTAEPKRR